MPRVEVTVDADRTAHLTLEGTQQTFPDLGAAMSELARYARHTQQPVNVSIHDGDTSRDLTFTPEGRLAPSQEQPSQGQPRETQTTTTANATNRAGGSNRTNPTNHPSPAWQLD